MLQSITIAAHATYPDAGETLDGLKELNFIFGTNGAGKTTISRVIDNAAAYPSCALNWHQGQEIETLVYNRDFVERNYRQQWDGIFTLGQTEGDILDRIEAGKNRVADLTSDIGRMEQHLGPLDGSSGKRGELKSLRSAFEADCWKIKTRHDEQFKHAFVGVRNSQNKFCDKVLSELTDNSAALLSMEEVIRKAAILFEDGLVRQDRIAAPDLQALVAVESVAILAKRVVGKQDVDVAALIKRLGNSDWVRQGLAYLDTGTHCPFCQQKIEADLADKLNAYFDETFLNDIAKVNSAVESYEVHAAAVLERLAISYPQKADTSTTQNSAQTATAWPGALQSTSGCSMARRMRLRRRLRWNRSGRLLR